MPEFPATTHGFAPQPAAVDYMLNAYGTTAQIDANLQASADRLVRVLEWPPPVDAMECHGGLAEAQAGRRQELANIVDARHALALADCDGMTCEHGYNPAVCDGYGNVGRRERLAASARLD